MQGNDLDNSPSRTVWVLSDVVFHAEPQKRRGRRKAKMVNVSDPAVLSKLWRYSADAGVRLELVFVGREAMDAVRLWDELDSGLNPFAAWTAFETSSLLAGHIPYRPDLVCIVDIPGRTAIYGGKGVRLEDLP